MKEKKKTKMLLKNYFKVIKSRKRRKQTRLKPIKDEHGKIINDSRDIMQKFREYFDDLLKKEGTNDIKIEEVIDTSLRLYSTVKT